MILEYHKLDLQDKSPFEKVRIKPPFTRRSDLPNEACFIHVLKGKMRLRTSTSIIEGDEKDALLVRCGTYISEIITQPEEFEALIVHFYPEIIEELFDSELNFKRRLDSTRKATVIQKDEIFNRYSESILFYFNNPELIDDELLKLKIKELIMLLLKVEDGGIVKEILHNLFKPTKIAFKEVVESHIYDDITINELAFLANRSLASLKRDFAKYYQEAPSSYIRRRKLEKAARLLKNSDLKIYQIVNQCGLKNASHFTKIFSERFGQSPSAFRLSHSVK